MKKTVLILMLVLLPAFALATGDKKEKDGHAKEAMENMKGMDKEEEHAAGVGMAGDPKKVTRTIQVTLNDTLRFTPAEITVKAGETIRFAVKNIGRLDHEMVIDSMEELKEHAEMMLKMGGKKMDPEPNSVLLESGKSGEIVWMFDKAGTIPFACLVPGHFEAGMIGELMVN